MKTTGTNACLQCGTAMKMKRETVQYDKLGLNLALDGVPVYRCPNCGEFEVSIRDMDGLHQEIAHALARRKERLRAEEVRFMRKYLGLSVEDFAKRMKADKGTVKHWESARPMNVQAEMLLRVMVLMDDSIQSYGLDEMASSKAAPKAIKAKPEKDGWHLTAA